MKYHKRCLQSPMARREKVALSFLPVGACRLGPSCFTNESYIGSRTRPILSPRNMYVCLLASSSINFRVLTFFFVPRSLPSSTTTLLMSVLPTRPFPFLCGILLVRLLPGAKILPHGHPPLPVLRVSFFWSHFSFWGFFCRLYDLYDHMTRSLVPFGLLVSFRVFLAPCPV